MSHSSIPSRPIQQHAIKDKRVTGVSTDIKQLHHIIAPKRRETNAWRFQCQRLGDIVNIGAVALGTRFSCRKMRALKQDARGTVVLV